MTPDRPRAEQRHETATGDDQAPPVGEWHELLERLGLAGIVYNVASHCELRQWSRGRFDFLLDAGNATLYNDSHDEKLRLALENYFGETVRITVTPGAPEGETPAMRADRLVRERQQQAVDAIDNDPQLQSLISRFDGELDRASILPTDVKQSFEVNS